MGQPKKTNFLIFLLNGFLNCLVVFGYCFFFYKDSIPDVYQFVGIVTYDQQVEVKNDSLVYLVNADFQDSSKPCFLTYDVESKRIKPTYEFERAAVWKVVEFNSSENEIFCKFKNQQYGKFLGWENKSLKLIDKDGQLNSHTWNVTAQDETHKPEEEIVNKVFAEPLNLFTEAYSEKELSNEMKLKVYTISPISGEEIPETSGRWVFMRAE